MVVPEGLPNVPRRQQCLLWPIQSIAGDAIAPSPPRRRVKPTRRWMSIREDLRPFGLRSPAQVTPVSSASGLAVSQLTFFDCTDTLYVLCQLVNTQCRGNFSPTSIHPSRNVYSEWRDLVISMRPVRAVTRSSRDDRAHQQRCAGKAGKGQRPKPHEINEFRPYPLFQLFQTHYEFVAGGHSRVPVAVTEPLLSPGNHLSLHRPDSVPPPSGRHAQRQVCNWTFSSHGSGQDLACNLPHLSRVLPGGSGFRPNSAEQRIRRLKRKFSA